VAVAGDAVTVRVPASSANLGPGFDCFAAAVGLFLELEVSPAPRFEVVTELAVPRDRSNLAVTAFERLHPADDLRFALRSEIPLSGGLGSSAAAVVAGLLAARRLAAGDGDVLALATAIEGHPDNAAAALFGGVVIVVDGAVERFAAPASLTSLLVVPHGGGVPTTRAREALPASVPLRDAVANTAHGALLVLGLERGDLALVARGLRDRLHEPYRAHLHPRSAALAADAASLGALGATISGAGPTVLVWVERDAHAVVAERLRERAAGWADVIEAAFESSGARLSSR
jgi:homoserine kinase